jgi:phytoene desaturase
MAKISVIGSGFSSLASAALLAKDGAEVNVFEKNPTIGGRARQFTEQGFVFDMGPSWYWMPDVFENYYSVFGYTSSDFYQLTRLDPGFRIFFGKNDYMDIPADLQELSVLFEQLEKGSSIKLRQFLKEAEYKYQKCMTGLIFKPGISMLEYLQSDVLSGLFRLHLLTPFHKYVRSYFKNPRLIALMEFPVLFLGAMPEDTPALYSIMNYAELVSGTWYPQGGMFEIVKAMENIARRQGVEFHLNSPVDKIIAAGNTVTGISSSDKIFPSDAVIAGADYHHVDRHLLDKDYKNYDNDYWESRKLSPSCLLAFIGVKRKVNNLIHHNLFFHEDLRTHANEIYKNPVWPSAPLLYICCPSKTDDSVAPDGCENIFILMPLAPGLEDNEEIRNKYLENLLNTTYQIIGDNFSDSIVYKKTYCINDFQKDYNAYKGNAYGLANTLKQTAFLKPKIINKKLKNLFYTGHLTVPGPGVPPAIISGQISAIQAGDYLMKKYERAF